MLVWHVVCRISNASFIVDMDNVPCFKQTHQQQQSAGRKWWLLSSVTHFACSDCLANLILPPSSPCARRPVRDPCKSPNCCMVMHLLRTLRPQVSRRVEKEQKKCERTKGQSVQGSVIHDECTRVIIVMDRIVQEFTLTLNSHPVPNSPCCMLYVLALNVRT